MGEFAVRNFDPRLGSTRWAAWTNQASNRPLITAQVRELVPVQEMLPFQRIIFQEFIQVTPAIGQTTIFQWQVPQDESWRLLSVSVGHSDPTNLIWTLDIESARDVNILMPVARVTVEPLLLIPLYPSAPGTGGLSTFGALAPPPREAFPGDRVQVRNRTPMTAAVPVFATFRWELIPLPLEDNRIALATAVSS